MHRARLSVTLERTQAPAAKSGSLKSIAERAVPFEAASCQTTMAQGGEPPVSPSVDDAESGGEGACDPTRYEVRATLGEGGMGEVLLCRDRRIGRDVAMKIALRSRADQPDLKARFLREARVQGQLEHPAIVPVYDMATDANGRPFFTMKRVRGLTLETVLGHLGAGESVLASEYTLHKLLAAFGRVCLAIDFAHSRGVVHRDLKPANVMLGDFGEVYVLDWGVAKVDGTDDLDDHGESDAATLDESGERPCAPNETEHGVVLGTPAYMAPEQQHGHPVDARTDIYALGAILFEILTHRGLWESRTRRGTDLTKALEWARDVPPELTATWRKATSRRPADRHASARELHDEIERYLIGDRDLFARRAFASAEKHRTGLWRVVSMETLAPLFFFLPALVVMGWMLMGRRTGGGWSTLLIVASFVVSGAVSAASHYENAMRIRYSPRACYKRDTDDHHT